jgi:hypothetical protein
VDAKPQRRPSSQITCLFNTVVPGFFVFMAALLGWTALVQFGPVGLVVVAIPVAICVACLWFLVRLPAVFIAGECIVVNGWLGSLTIPLPDICQITEWRLRNMQFANVSYVDRNGKRHVFRFLASLLAISAREEHPDIAYFRACCGALPEKNC